LQPKLTLDVGAAQGFLGQLLAGSALTIDAVEPRQQCAERAGPFYRRVFASPIEQVQLPPSTYEAVVCADVLEHLLDPLSVLRRLRAAATPDAAFIISLPNVAHLAVRLMLLFGSFPRMERGILDRTHLHFFTRDTAEEMLRAAGLRIEQAHATSAPLEELWPGAQGRWPLNGLMRMQHLAIGLAPRLFAFQWVFVARGRV
jgi:2-polyprenyl-3-methyl-5-hydroxy-6-metoxy-1,4-benzoquinol methylase